MELIKVVLLGIIISILTVFLKQVKSEYAIICVIVGSVILLGFICNSLIDVFSFFDQVIVKTGIDYDLFLTMLKIIGVGYLVEFSANICRDSGNNSIADKVVLAGKIMIFVMSMPIISSLFNLVLDMVQ